MTFFSIVAGDDQSDILGRCPLTFWLSIVSPVTNLNDAWNGLKYSQGPKEMCLSLEHQNPSKTSEKMGYFDRVTVSLHILLTANQETEGSQDRLTV